jgi:hypothetical protein
MSTKIEKRLRRIANVIINQAIADETFAEKLEKAITDEISNVKHRDPPVLDPVELIRENEEELTRRLKELSENQLKDIIANFRLDLTGRARHWHNIDQLIHCILESARSKATKGDVFRA